MSDHQPSEWWLPSILHRLLSEASAVDPVFLEGFRSTHQPVQNGDIVISKIPEDIMRFFALGIAKAHEARDCRTNAAAAAEKGDTQSCGDLMSCAWQLEMEKNYIIDVAWRELHIQCRTWLVSFSDVFIRQGDMFVVIASSTKPEVHKKHLH